MEEEADELNVINERDFVRLKDQRLVEIQKAAATDIEQRLLSKIIQQGWPDRIQQVPEMVRKYWTFRELLVVQDGIIYKGKQVIIPVALRTDYLRCLHTSHMGSESTIRRAREAVYWPGMAADIEQVTRQCTVWEEDGPAQTRDKLLAHDIPALPWMKVGMDLFTCKGKDYLIVVDYLTDFLEVSELPNTVAATVVHSAKQHFARHGIPMIVHSDGGPQFMSREFMEFAKKWEFQHTVSSPYNSRSNGKAESAVKIVKKLFKRSTDPYLALLEWRNTPTAGLDSSPCQRLMGRQIRGVVPSAQANLASGQTIEVWRKKMARQQQTLSRYDGRGRTLRKLNRGEPVLVQDLRAKKTQWVRGRCWDQLTDRSYTVEVDGQLLHRNRQFLKPSQNLPPTDTEQGGPTVDNGDLV